MKKFALIIFTAFLANTNLTPLIAMSIGQDGNPFTKNDVEWQKVYYTNDDAGFTATMPGSPTAGVFNGDAYSYSKYQDVNYEIHCRLNERFIPPKKENIFMQQVRDVFENTALILPVHSNQKKVKYIAELHFNEESKTCRIYCSKNCLYWAIVEGQDLSLAPLFFDSIKITK